MVVQEQGTRAAAVALELGRLLELGRIDVATKVLLTSFVAGWLLATAALRRQELLLMRFIALFLGRAGWADDVYHAGRQYIPALHEGKLGVDVLFVLLSALHEKLGGLWSLLLLKYPHAVGVFLLHHHCLKRLLCILPRLIIQSVVILLANRIICYVSYRIFHNLVRVLVGRIAQDGLVDAHGHRLRVLNLRIGQFKGLGEVVKAHDLHRRINVIET